MRKSRVVVLAAVGLLLVACGRVDYRGKLADFASDAPTDGDALADGGPADDGDTPDAAAGDAASCACDQDVHRDPDGGVVLDISDLADVRSCFGNPTCTPGARADVNCDGVVDVCDLDDVSGSLFSDPDPTYCEREPCGACEAPDGGCERRARSPCREDPDGAGIWRGQRSVCP